MRAACGRRGICQLLELVSPFRPLADVGLRAPEELPTSAALASTLASLADAVTAAALDSSAVKDAPAAFADAPSSTVAASALASLTRSWFWPPAAAPCGPRSTAVDDDGATPSAACDSGCASAVAATGSALTAACCAPSDMAGCSYQAQSKGQAPPCKARCTVTNREPVGAQMIE